MQNMFIRFVSWLPIGVAVTLMTGMLYAAVQQTYRQGANDPQIQIVTEVAHGLEQGQPVKGLDAAQKDELATSLAPFVLAYDQDGKLVASSATLDGGEPIVPIGALRETDDGDQNRITWQPRKGVREAII